MNPSTKNTTGISTSPTESVGRLVSTSFDRVTLSAAAADMPIALLLMIIGTTLVPIQNDPMIHTANCVIATPPMPMILPASRISGRTLLITTSATRVAFSSITLRSTVWP